MLAERPGCWGQIGAQEPIAASGDALRGDDQDGLRIASRSISSPSQSNALW